MAHRYSATIDGASNVSPGAAYCEMIAGASKPICVRSINVTTKTNIGGSIGISRAFTVGTGTSTATGLPHRLGSPSTDARLQSAWSSNPTGFVSRLRADVMPVGTGMVREIWKMDDGPLVVEPGSSILLLNGASGIDGAGLRISCTWEEGPAGDG